MMTVLLLLLIISVPAGRHAATDGRLLLTPRPKYTKVMTYNCQPPGKKSDYTRADKQLVVLEKAMSTPELFDFIGTQEECQRALKNTPKGDVLADLGLGLGYAVTGGTLTDHWGSPIIYSSYRWTEEQSGQFMIANPYTNGWVSSLGLHADTRPCNWGIYSKNLVPHTRDVNQGYTVLIVNCHFPHSDNNKTKILKGPSLMNQVTSQVEVATGEFWGKKQIDQMWMTGDMNEFGILHAGNNTNGFPVKIFDQQLKQGVGASTLKTLKGTTADRVYYWTAAPLKKEPTAELADTSGASDHHPVKVELQIKSHA